MIDDRIRSERAWRVAIPASHDGPGFPALGLSLPSVLNPSISLSLSYFPVPDQSALPLLKHLTAGGKASRRKGGEERAALKPNFEVER